MARNKYNKANEEDEPMRFENPCYFNHCHHNRDKKKRRLSTICKDSHLIPLGYFEKMER